MINIAFFTSESVTKYLLDKNNPILSLCTHQPHTLNTQNREHVQLWCPMRGCHPSQLSEWSLTTVMSPMGQSQLCQQFYLHNKSVDTMMDGCMGGCGGNADKYLHNNPWWPQVWSWSVWASMVTTTTTHHQILHLAHIFVWILSLDI